MDVGLEDPAFSGGPGGTDLIVMFCSDFVNDAMIFRN